MKSEFLIAVTQLAAERNLPQEMVVEAVEAALASAYRKENATGGQSNVRVHLDPGTGEVEVFQLKTVVEEVENDLAELTIEEAKKLRKGSDPKIDDVLEFEMEPQAAGRIAAQTAKQVVIQRLREAERELIFSEFAEREGEVFTGTVQRGGAYGGVVTLDLNGRATAVLPATEQGMAERYRPGMKMKVMIVEVSRTPRGPEIIVSRTHPDLLRRLFEMEVPEIYNGIVEIRGIAREPGSRSKVAVHAKQDGVDPVGACVGLRGIRIQNIVNELQGEKIDVIQWSKDDAVFLAHALSPAQPLRVELDAEEQTATVIVPDRSLSLAIGREGQNARLAAKLTGWKVDIKSSTEIEIERMKRQIEGDVAERETAAEPATAEAAAEPATAEAVAEPAAAEAPATPEAPAEVPSEDAAIMAELEAEAATVEPPAEPEAAPALSAEEMLALESLDIQAPDEVEEIIVEEEAVPEADADAAVWKTPEPVGGGTAIRFAEDILGGPSRNRRTGTRRRSSRGPARGPFRGPNRGAPPGGARPPSSGGGPSGAGGRPGA
ncbi:MAG: transcription termination/antitermination protein NusA [Chloroflexi bacterium]|nr:transcription termination/antitermination protein NusA [Chloroflexota bacterium]